METSLALCQSYIKFVRNGNEALVLPNVSVNSLVYKRFLDEMVLYCAVVSRHAGEGAGGAFAPPAFQLGEQGEQKCHFICNDLLSNC